MGKEYTKISPERYLEENEGQIYPDYERIVGVPIKLGIDPDTNEMFDEIMKQLIDDGMINVSEFEGKHFIRYADNSGEYTVLRVAEDKGEGVMVTINDSGTLSPYEEEKQIEVDETDLSDEDYEYDEEEEEEEEFL